MLPVFNGIDFLSICNSVAFHTLNKTLFWAITAVDKTYGIVKDGLSPGLI